MREILNKISNNFIMGRYYMFINRILKMVKTLIFSTLQIFKDPIKVLASDFMGIDKLILEFVLRDERDKIISTIKKEKVEEKKIGRQILCDIRTYLK